MYAVQEEQERGRARDGGDPTHLADTVRKRVAHPEPLLLNELAKARRAGVNGNIAQHQHGNGVPLESAEVRVQTHLRKSDDGGRVVTASRAVHQHSHLLLTTVVVRRATQWGKEPELCTSFSI